MERLKFIAIFASNLDEFFMVRVGSLFDEYAVDETIVDSKSGMTIQQQLDMIFNEVCRLSQRLGDAYQEIISALFTGMPPLSSSGIISIDAAFPCCVFAILFTVFLIPSLPGKVRFLPERLPL